MTRLEQLQSAIFPLISKQQRNEGLIYSLITNLCPADKTSCNATPDERCFECWNREVQ